MLGSKKKLQACKPDSVRVPPLAKSSPGPSFICTGNCSPVSSCLPCNVFLSEFGRAALQRYYTWHFSMQGLPPEPVTRNRRGLLPHVFTLTLTVNAGAVIFCGTVCPRFPGARLFTGALRCAVRTFLHPPKRIAIARPVTMISNNGLQI
jgi:hypothetical protein